MSDIVAKIKVIITLQGGANTELEFGYNDDRAALIGFGKLLGYKGKGIMAMLGPIVPAELQQLLSSKDAP